MRGFPTRLTRQLFGPRFRDARPVEDSETECGEGTLNPLIWQVAGMNLVAPRVSLVAHYTGSSFLISHRSEAWNPEEKLTRPTLARSAAGVYTYTFAANYPDESGVQVDTYLGAARVTAQKAVTAYANRVDGYAWRDGTNPLVINIALYNSAGAGVDEPFWLEVL